MTLRDTPFRILMRVHDRLDVDETWPIVVRQACTQILRGLASQCLSPITVKPRYKRKTDSATSGLCEYPVQNSDFALPSPIAAKGAGVS